MNANLWRVLALRGQQWRNRAASRPSNRPLTLLMSALGVIALLGAGHLLAPDLLAPPEALATSQGVDAGRLPPGQNALEAAFWLSALLAAVLNFRVMELLFRRSDALALQPLPIRPSAFFVDRTLSTLTEATLSAAGASLLFVPLFWKNGAGAALAAIAMLFGALWLGAGLSMCAMVLAGRQLVPDGAPSGGGVKLGGDVYGGSGQIFLYAPGVGLAAVVIAALFWKLLLGEPLRLERLSEPFLIGSALLAAAWLVAIVTSWRTFAQHYHAMAARFREADSAEFQAVMDYQRSSFETPQRLEQGLSRGAALAYRALVLDGDRRLAAGRVGYAVVLVLAAIGLAAIDAAARPSWAVAITPMLMLALIINPWLRVSRQAERLQSPTALPLAPVDVDNAIFRLAVREVFFLALPFALLVALINGVWRTEPGAWIVALASLALATGLASALRLLPQTHTRERWLPAGVALLIAALAGLSLPAALGVSLLLIATALFVPSTAAPGRSSS
ncbi:hypothetical protein EA187_03070 [Lujinxingia sediminis]|uniref:ABC transporter permease n=1 Tax=Lujinxingia sediminis TaxID=2480984 RepID=A0ABY0CXR2_9DELT|nr:hypothetical protein [Lujinxingia sediminis]RVU48430.1 hypothetical protein EA187_03070 [Lujinxingia sediminis]